MNQHLPRKTKSPPNQATQKLGVFKSQSTFKPPQKRQSAELAGGASKMKLIARSPPKTLETVPQKKLEASFDKASHKKTIDAYVKPPTTGKRSREESPLTRKAQKPQRTLSPNKKNLDDDGESNLRDRVSILEKSCEFQDKAIKELDQKISAERLELSQLSQQFSAKKQTDYQIKEHEEAEVKQHEQELSPEQDKNGFKAAKLAINEFESQQTKYGSLPNTRAASGDQSSIGVNNRRFGLVTSAEENYKYKWLHLKDYVNTIESHYELKLAELKLENERLIEENYRLKYRHSSVDGVNDQYFNNLDCIYKKKIGKAEARYEQKEREIYDREISFRQEVENLNARIRELQLELNNKAKVDEKVRELKSQLALREKEISNLKTYYTEKLKLKADEISKVKADNSKVQMGYLDEIRELKRDIDRMAYDNKKLSLTHANHNTHMLITSLVT